jgi:hypothetical protein
LDGVAANLLGNGERIGLRVWRGISHSTLVIH